MHLKPDSKYEQHIETKAVDVYLRIGQELGWIARWFWIRNGEVIVANIEKAIYQTERRGIAEALRGEHGPMKPLTVFHDPDFVPSVEIE